AEKMQRHVRLVANHPAVVRRRWNVKEASGTQLDDGPVFEGSGCSARDDEADVLDRAARRTDSRSDVDRPLPAGVVRGAADREAADPHDLEASLLHLAYFVGTPQSLGCV